VPTSGTTCSRCRGSFDTAGTAVECTRNRLADLIGRDVAEVDATCRSASGSVVVDPFAGSCNTLYWIARHVSARRAVGFELVVRDSLAEVAARGNWSNLKMYDLDPAGTNHGLLLGTLGWTP